MNQQIRAAAGEAISWLVRTEQNLLPWGLIEKGFVIDGKRILFATRARGIFKPKELTDGCPLSIRTSRPSRTGRTALYKDDIDDSGIFRYKLQGTDPDNADNKLLARAMETRTPLIYFFGLADALYTVVYPAFITAIDRFGLEASVATDAGDSLGPLQVAEPGVERGYKDRIARDRIHQAKFRQIVLAAYQNKCAISGLPIPRLLQAAHIIPDRHPDGRPSVQNGLCLSNHHHGAFDAGIIGIDPDGVVHVSEEAMEAIDGPFLDVSLKSLRGMRIRSPSEARLQPDRDMLAERFELFQEQSA